MDAAAELGRNRVSKHQIQPNMSMEMSRLTRDGTAEPVSRNQILRRERDQGNIHLPCSVDHEQDWQPYRVDPYTLAIVYVCGHSRRKGVTIKVTKKSFIVFKQVLLCIL